MKQTILRIILLMTLTLSPFFMLSQIQMQPTATIFSPNQKINDLERIQFRQNCFPNSNFETWNDHFNPYGLSQFTTSDKTSFYATTPDHPVFEGTRSLAMVTKAPTKGGRSIVTLTQNSWVYWDNPVNCTFSFNYYIASLPNISLDYFMVEVRINYRYMVYYLGNDLSLTNLSSAVYFMIDSPLQTWNLFSRNVSSDYIEAFNETPSSFKTINWKIDSATPIETRVYLDNVVLLNNTSAPRDGNGNLILENGDFEDYTGWALSSTQGLGEVSRSNDAVQGDWSLNVTTRSTQTFYNAQAYVTAGIGRRIYDKNQDIFSFSWKISNFTGTDDSTYTYIKVELSNTTLEFNVYYIIANGGSTLLDIGTDKDYVIPITNFNKTEQWYFFNTSIWADIGESNYNDIFIENIRVVSNAGQPSTRISTLFDNFTLELIPITDGNFETQGEVGSPIHSGSLAKNPDTSYTVTDFAKSGSKAANLTLIDDYFYNDYQLPLFNFNTEWILDLSYYIQEFNETGLESCIVVYIGTSENSLNYILANSSYFDLQDYFEDEYITLSNNVVKNQWINIQLDPYQDYIQFFGSAPQDIRITSVELYVVSYNDKASIFFDDFYFYQDPAPTISSIISSNSFPTISDSVTISATVIDATLDTVTLNYRINSGTWIHSTMTLINESFQATIPPQESNSIVEYYISAIDEYNKSTSTEIFDYKVTSTTTTTTTTTSTTTTTTTTTSTTTTTTTKPKANPGFDLVLTFFVIISLTLIIGHKRRH